MGRVSMTEPVSSSVLAESPPRPRLRVLDSLLEPREPIKVFLRKQNAGSEPFFVAQTTCFFVTTERSTSEQRWWSKPLLAPGDNHAG